MGKAGRFACILTPMLLTVASLICFIIVMIGQAPLKGNDAPSTELGRDLYFFQADTSKFTADPQTVLDNVPGVDHIDNSFLNAIQGSASSGELKDFYQVGLWSYCEGDRDNNGKETITKCSARKFQFHFDPVEVWGLQNTTVQDVLGDKFQSGMNTYKKVAGWMNWAFVITVILTAAEFVIGFFAIFSRWGSLITTIVSTAQTVFAIAAAATATALYGTLTGVFKSVLEPYNIEASMGSQMLSVLWLAVAFSIASGFFWLISVCCCSGKSPHKKVVVEKTPYTYERVASPAFGQQQQGHTSYAGAAHKGQAPPTTYEPFRSRV
ncbi:similar to integral membrane protein [Plenodomus lingam JN3]|uniref:Similar to integral membrane protein n=1 Tax=Leptosphaeria maculans (strain JN3 / isolate v23.1.3 / race Av1-4-5-6-7-8) TaxID=985895 RepID=E4ZUQ9_LEPMJ|nr:similar to integral membrane protein [Plenodomus lingam JN3]CBX95138.1 similar to integral membrane protein [Plenodomus lingam JN3]